MIITTLDEKAATTLQSQAEYPSHEGGAISAATIGQLYYTRNQRPQEGIALTAPPYHTLATFHCLIDIGSQINMVNWQDVQAVLGDEVDWDDHPPTLSFSPVGGGARPPLASLQPGTLDLVFKYGTTDQTIIRTGWSVLAGDDKRGTPLIGTGVFRRLQMEWQACQPNGTDGALTYQTAQGRTATLALAYTEPRRLPEQAEIDQPYPIEHSRGTTVDQ